MTYLNSRIQKIAKDLSKPYAVVYIQLFNWRIVLKQLEC